MLWLVYRLLLCLGEDKILERIYLSENIMRFVNFLLVKVEYNSRIGWEWNNVGI